MLGPRGILRDVRKATLMAVEQAPRAGSAAFPHPSKFTVVAYEQLGGEAQAPAGRVS